MCCNLSIHAICQKGCALINCLLIASTGACEHSCASTGSVQFDSRSTMVIKLLGQSDCLSDSVNNDSIWVSENLQVPSHVICEVLNTLDRHIRGKGYPKHSIILLLLFLNFFLSLKVLIIVILFLPNIPYIQGVYPLN